MMARSILQRGLISMLLGILVAIGVNEFSFIFLKSEAGRGPQRIELLIPTGTSEKVARGESNPALPDKMVFVVGDTLVVKNEDVVAHKLGPLFIPAGASASLTLNNANNQAVTCSFNPGQYLGLDVREAVDFDTRLYGLLISGIPLGFLFALYSILIWPLKPKTVTSQ